MKKSIKTLLAVLCMGLAFVACQEEPQPTTQPTPTPEQPKKPAQKSVKRIPFEHPEWIAPGTMYTANIRTFTEEGTIKAFKQQLTRITAMGVKIVRLMPVQIIGAKNRQGELGNPYSISDYLFINPDFGTAAEFKELIDAMHKIGLKVILDWEPNHTSFDNEWTTIRPDVYTGYYQNTGLQPAKTNSGKPIGQDVADLDYNQEDTYGMMTEAMRTWITEYDLDGFYWVDAAHVPVKFFSYAVERLKQTKQDLLFLTDHEDLALLNAADANAGNEFYNILLNIATNSAPATEEITTYLARFKKNHLTNDAPVYYTSGPKLNAFNNNAATRFNGAEKPCFLLAATFQSGIVNLFGGQEFNTASLDFYNKDFIAKKRPDAFYSQVLQLKKNNTALHAGQFGGTLALLENNQPNTVVSYVSQAKNNSVITVVNLSNAEANFTLFTPSIAGNYTNYFTKEKTKLGAKTNFTLPAFGYLVLTQ